MEQNEKAALTSGSNTELTNRLTNKTDSKENRLL